MRRKLLVVVVVLVAAGGAWVGFNPPGKFGKVCFFGLTTYNCVPYPMKDFEVSAGGERRFVEKTHHLGLSKLEWILREKPDVVVIGTGWNEAVEVAPEVAELKDVLVVTLPTGDAVQAYNLYKKSGRRVAIHLHATC